MKQALFHRPDQMTPMRPSGRILALAESLVEHSARLDGAVPPRTAKSLRTLVRLMNSYYSNLIEGHHTRPREIEEALRRPEHADLETLAVAHVRTDEAIDSALEHGEKVYSPEFISWIHRDFYKRVPEEMRIVKGSRGRTAVVEPGRFRDQEVEVGEHVAPSAEAVPRLLEFFCHEYANAQTKTEAVSNAAAAHHRLVWIHPFLDGNGRVARLHTHAAFRAAGVMSSGLWSISRGLARDPDGYKKLLANADSARRGDYDGRGNLSQAALDDFCRGFLSVALDQVGYMEGAFALEGLQDRLQRCFAVYQPKVREEAWRLVFETIIHGEIDRGEAPRITGLGERIARDLLSEMLDLGILATDSPKGKVYAAFPIELVGWYFPDLFPPQETFVIEKEAAGIQQIRTRKAS